MLKYGFLAIIGTILAVVASTYGLHRSSYCFGDWRFVPDQEMIKAAILDEMRPINTRALNGTGRNPGERYLPIKDIEEFELLNPGCCRILTGNEESKALYHYSILSGILGYYAVVVGIEHNIRFLDDKGIQHQRFVFSTIPVSSCGRVHLDTYRGG